MTESAPPPPAAAPRPVHPILAAFSCTLSLATAGVALWLITDLVTPFRLFQAPTSNNDTMQLNEWTEALRSSLETMWYLLPSLLHYMAWVLLAASAVACLATTTALIVRARTSA